MLHRLERQNLLNAAFAMGGLVGPTIVQLLFVIVAARALSTNDFGKLMLAIAVATILITFSGIGAGGVALKMISRRPHDAAIYFGQAIAVALVTAPIMILISILVTQFVLPDTKILLAISISFSELLCWRLAQTCQQVFIGLGQHSRNAFIGMLIPTARLVAATLVFVFHPGDPLSFISVAYLVSTLISVSWCIWLTSRWVGTPIIRIGDFDWREGVNHALTWLNAAIQVEVDKLILAYFATPADVGLYALASRLMDGAFMPARALKISTQSKLFSLGQEGHKAAFSVIVRMLPFVIVYGLFAWACVYFGTPLIISVFGQKYSGLSDILPVLGLVPLLRGVADMGAETFIVSDRTELQTALQLLVSGFRIIVGGLLMYFCGLQGAAIGAALTWLFSIFLFWRLAWRHTRQ